MKVRKIRLEALAHREAEERLRRAYLQLWQACWEKQVQSQERCENGKESSHIRPGIHNPTITGRDD